VPVYFVGATPFNLLGLDRWTWKLFATLRAFDAIAARVS
jgi:hypothetical protein